MDQVYIDALVNQALGAYKAAGDEGLKRWKEALPAPHLEAFERDCGELLLKAIAGLDLSRGPGELDKDKEKTEGRILTDYESSEKALKKLDPRKEHTRDRRRTKPL